MFEVISEWSVIYFKVGACIGFGIGAVAQLLSDKTSRDWTLATCLLLTGFWPYLLWDVAFGERR